MANRRKAARGGSTQGFGFYFWAYSRTPSVAGAVG
jgi:hypothetical protein